MSVRWRYSLSAAGRIGFELQSVTVGIIKLAVVRMTMAHTEVYVCFHTVRDEDLNAPALEAYMLLMMIEPVEQAAEKTHADAA